MAANTDSSPGKPQQPPGSSKTAPAFSRPALTLFDCVCIIVGTIIGSGIFKTPSLVAAQVPSAFWLIVIWLIGGAIALAGALCFAELTTTYPDRGGDYGYLKRAFDRRFGFAFSWAAFWVIRPGNIGAMAVIFGVFAVDAVPGISSRYPQLFSPLTFAAAAVVATSAANLAGLYLGKWTQNVLAVAKVVGILLIILAALIDTPAPAAAAEANTVAATATETASEAPASTEWFWLSMVFVMYSFGGWNDIAFVASEVRHPQRNLFRALMLGTGAVALIYLVVNLALVQGLGFERMSQLGADNAPFVLVSEAWGEWGGRLLAVLVCVSCLGAISAMIFTSPRIYWATALDYPSLSWMAGTRDGHGWWPAMLLQAVVTMLFVVVFGRQSDGFDVIVNASAPYFWLFLAATVFGLIVCRFRYAGRFEGFRVPGYPLVPIGFILACLFMVVRSYQYMIFQELQWAAITIGAWVLLGVGLSFVIASVPESEQSENGEA